MKRLPQRRCSLGKAPSHKLFRRPPRRGLPEEVRRYSVSSYLLVLVTVLPLPGGAMAISGRFGRAPSLAQVLQDNAICKLPASTGKALAYKAVELALSGVPVVRSANGGGAEDISALEDAMAAMRRQYGPSVSI